MNVDLKKKLIGCTFKRKIILVDCVIIIKVSVTEFNFK